MTLDLAPFEKEEYCYLTTKGRKTGTPHEIEIWFTIHENAVYLLSGGMEKSDWVKNLLQDPKVTLRIAGQTFSAFASILEDKELEPMIRMAMAIKYDEWEGQDPSEWARTALVVKFIPQSL